MEAPTVSPAPAGNPAGWKENSVFVAVLIILVVIVMAGLQVRRTLARRLGRAGWTLFTLKNCGYCDRQMAILGGWYPHIVSCPGKTKDASSQMGCNGVKGFPYWHNLVTGETRPGLQDRNDLLSMAAA